MKKIGLGLVGAVVVLLIAGYWGAGSASADNGPHVVDRPMTTDACAGCHRAHTATGSYLLKEASEEALCESCHDGTQATTNVVHGMAVSGVDGEEGVFLAALRGGGFDFAWVPYGALGNTFRYSLHLKF